MNIIKRRDCLKLIGATASASLLSKNIRAVTTASVQQQPQPGFGVSALTFGRPGRVYAIELHRFLRAGGFPQVTPTRAWLWWDENLLHAEFWNMEPDSENHGNSGLAKPITYPGNSRFEISAYPDAVYVQFRPSWHKQDNFIFAADSSGACNHSRFRCEVTRQDRAWTAHFQIPWALVGGKPGISSFGINVVRSRGQSSEVLSPVVLDQTLILPPDLLMSGRFGEKPKTWSVPGCLITLPDGIRRWQLPAHPAWPTEEEHRELWIGQQGLNKPTTPGTLAGRVHLAQRLYDMLVLEGFSFHADGANWPVGPGEFYPSEARIAVNQALCDSDLQRACDLLDIYLDQLNRVSRRWFADESPGNIRTSQWVPVTAMSRPQREGNEIRLDGKAGKHAYSLWLSFCNGAVRIRGQHAGFFEPEYVETWEMESNSFASGDLHMRIENHPWRIFILDNENKERWSVGHGDLFLRLSSVGEVIAVDLRGNLARYENCYGFGERFNALGQRGNVVTLWDVDCWEGNIHGRLNQAYKNVPLMHSTAGYSLFWNTTYRLRADIGNANSGRYRLTAFGNILDIYLWPTTPERALHFYLSLTGNPILPPRWAFEPWMGGGGRRWSNGPLHNAVRQELYVVNRFRELDIPHSAIYAEAGNANPALYAGLMGTGLHVLAWVWGSMDISTVLKLLPHVPREKLPVLRHANGEIAFRSDQNAILDYTHPLAGELLQRFWHPRFDLGVAGSMVDFGDMVPADAVFHNGKTGFEMHNFYAFSYHGKYAEVFEKSRDGDYVQIGRNGCAGDQKSICYFAGDHQANFFGMRGALRGGLNAAACGFSTWGADAGGYAGWPDPEVYMRWTEWATFCPLMRFHGTTPREPWEYGDLAVTIYKKHAWLRENLLPYIQQSAQLAHQMGPSIMRPMPMAFPDCPSLSNCDDQYLFGPDLLIAPVLGPGSSREVILPPGTWTDFWTCETFRGPAKVVVPTPIDRIGVLIRPGAAIPVELAKSLVFGESMSPGRVKALWVTRPDRSGPVHVKTNGASFLFLYEGGKRRVFAIEPEQEHVNLPV